MSLPQVSNQVAVPQNFHRGITIGSITNAIAAAGVKNGVTYKTKTKRAIRMKMVALMIRPDIESFNELSDNELQGMMVACTAGVDQIAQWLDGQDFECQTITTTRGEYEEEWGPSDW